MKVRTLHLVCKAGGQPSFPGRPCRGRQGGRMDWVRAAGGTCCMMEEGRQAGEDSALPWAKVRRQGPGQGSKSDTDSQGRAAPAGRHETTHLFPLSQYFLNGCLHVYLCTILFPVYFSAACDKNSLS